MTRFYIKPKDDPHGPHIAMYVGNLPTGLSQRQYEKILFDTISKSNGQTDFLSGKYFNREALLWKDFDFT